MSTTTRTEADEYHALLRTLDKPSLENLSYCLRHPETWPEGFVWNYKDCETCAAGLAHELWKSIPKTDRGNIVSVMANKFSIPYSIAMSLFMNANHNRPTKWFFGLVQTPILQSSVTPEMIADDIDTYLAQQGARK